MESGVWLVTGAQASGKTTIADLLARQFERGVHVRGGQFYRWVVTGWVPFDDAGRRDEARRLLGLRYRLSAEVTQTYADAGFSCVTQDNIYGADVTDWLATIQRHPVHLVVLRPRVEVVTAREEARRFRTGKVAYRAGFTPADNDEHLAGTPNVGLWLDTSELTPEETVAEILRREDESLIQRRL